MMRDDEREYTDEEIETISKRILADFKKENMDKAAPTI